MIFTLPDIGVPIDQGDLIDGCPILRIAKFDPDDPIRSEATCVGARVTVLTQTCDLVQGKATQVAVAIIFPAQELVDNGLIKAADVRGSVRMGRVYGWYFLPKSSAPALPESIVDFRNLHTVPLSILKELVQHGRRVAHLESPYREHLAKHFSDTYSRIGLPMPYETD